MARGKGKAKQHSLRAAGMLPMLKKPAEAVGHYLHVPGAFWDKCPAADKEKSYKCVVREFAALHKFGGGQPPSAAFEVQEMGEKGTGSAVWSLVSQAARSFGSRTRSRRWATTMPALGYHLLTSEGGKVVDIQWHHQYRCAWATGLL